MALEYPRLERRKLSDLCVTPCPTRVVSTEALFHLRKQYEAFGILQIHVVLNVTTGNLLGGRRSVQVMRDLGIEEAPVWCVQLPADMEDAASMALQNHASEWQWRPVSEKLKTMKQLGLGLQLSGFHDYDTGPLVSAEWTRVDVQKRVDADAREQQTMFL